MITVLVGGEIVQMLDQIRGKPLTMSRICGAPNVTASLSSSKSEAFLSVLVNSAEFHPGLGLPVLF